MEFDKINDVGNNCFNGTDIILIYYIFNYLL